MITVNIGTFVQDTAVTFFEGAGAYEVSLKNGEVHHENMKSINIE